MTLQKAEVSTLSSTSQETQTALSTLTTTLDVLRRKFCVSLDESFISTGIDSRTEGGSRKHWKDLCISEQSN
eukprot:m.120543 g.120543  ORF g.120543 m.120543 type:complete len:72 (-) comp9372_c0_seq2:1065-1280(-)